jgi:hypothetical protein
MFLTGVLLHQLPLHHGRRHGAWLLTVVVGEDRVQECGRRRGEDPVPQPTVDDGDQVPALCPRRRFYRT